MNGCPPVVELVETLELRTDTAASHNDTSHPEKLV